MKKLLLLALTAMMMVGCGEYKGRDQQGFTLLGYSSVEIDSCQYIIGLNVLAHKGNCKYCAERRKQELKELVEQLKK